MIGDTVAIEIPDAVSERDQGRAVGACEAVLGDDRCSLIAEDAEADWIARVTRSSLSELTIELLVTGQKEVTAVRVLNFLEDEPEAFRWQSVGVVVAALILSQDRAPTVAEPPRTDPPEPEPVEEPEEAPSPVRAAPETRARGEDSPPPREVATLDLAGLVAANPAGPGVSGGGWIGAGLRLVGPLYVLAQGDATFGVKTEGVTDLSASAFGGSLGVAVRGDLGGPSFGWEVSARGAAQGLGVRASSEIDSGSASTLRWGVRAGLGLVFRPAGFVGIVVGADTGVLWPPLDLEVGEADPVRVSPLFWGGYLGVRLRLKRS